MHRLNEYLKKQKEEREHVEFPDEIDTPQHMPASERFARYRGLKSFRQTPWDPCENLPLDYSKIYQFQNFKRSKKAALDAMDLGIPAATFVTLHIKNVPASMKDAKEKKQVFAIFGLRPHEHRMSICNFTIKRDQDDSEPLKSKDSVIVMIGYRRYVVNPIYSTFTRSGPNNVHKFERYLPHGVISMATCYAPIHYGSAPVTMFRNTPDLRWDRHSMPTLIGFGTLVDPEPLRIVAKRIILTGHPFKIHKRGAVVRFMFYSPKDIDYFKPIQLRTKFGRIGHIKESLGTHGYMKCQFDKPIKQHDTVCMNLYKRIFPKWTTKMFRVEDGSCKDNQEMVI